MVKVLCALILYKPSIDLLKKVIESVVSQVDCLWISDNTPDGFSPITILCEFGHRIRYEKMDGNVGVAKAQNYAIKYAIENNYDYIFFLDQDSISPDNIVDNLIAKFMELEDEGINVGGVGPQPYDRDTNKAYLPNIKKGHFIKTDVKEVTEIISSASLIKTSLFRRIGMMDELLFTDNVDHEMCWRATAKEGYRFFMITSILLSHKLGEGDRHFGGITIKIATPFRTFFQYRNYFILVRRSYVPLYWKISHGVKYICKYFYYPLFCKPRSGYFININRGILRGVTKRF